RARFGQNLAHPTLMDRISIAVEESDGDACYAESVEVQQQRVQSRFVQWPEHGAGGIDALGHREAAEAGDQRDWFVDEDGVRVVVPFVGDVEDVAKALGGEEGGDRSLALDNSVGCKRRAMDEEINLGRGYADLRQQFDGTRHHRLLRRV